ncbi:hypothetical protein B0T19DRAFT_39097 [Cercophora scortea]|uniref:Uncharacterized protein n=1 Tax=Cercophora scortea TaxID=314031 RepID=A0AAE0J3T6_9PEZI|nr:hypothetical protein B0T19DRAFT_39097 [Cercophora scortea]
MRRPISACKEGTLPCCTCNSAIEAAFIAPTHPHPARGQGSPVASTVESVGTQTSSIWLHVGTGPGVPLNRLAAGRMFPFLDGCCPRHCRHTPPPRPLDIWKAVFQTWSCYRGVALNRGGNNILQSGQTLASMEEGDEEEVEMVTSVHATHLPLVPARRLASAVWPGCRESGPGSAGGGLHILAGSAKAPALHLQLRCCNPATSPSSDLVQVLFRWRVERRDVLSEHEPRAFMMHTPRIPGPKSVWLSVGTVFISWLKLGNRHDRQAARIDRHNSH